MELNVEASRSFEERLERKLDALAAEVAELNQATRARQELFSEFGPILKHVMSVATERLELAEHKGYFAMGRELFGLIDGIVENYTADDVAALGRNMVTILDTVRSLTQPELLALLGDVSEVADNAEKLDPVGVVGMAKASQDEDAQRGMAVLVEVLRRLGKGVKRARRRESLNRQLGSRRAPNPVAVTRQRRIAEREQSVAPPPVPETPVTGTAPAPLVAVAGVEFTPEGFLANRDQWSPELATRIAGAIGVELTPEHWKLIEYARGEFARSGASPNIRRLTTGSGISTKQIYQMFPKAPGKCTAMIAGLPKPVGCI
jgi:tRNA 2-thiouridine synthesizing protein E